jgi:hypothetical protein
MPDPAADVRRKLEALTTGPTWRPGDHPEVEAYLASISEYLDVFKTEVEKPGYRFRPAPDPKDPRNPMLITLPWTVSSRYAAHSLLALSWREGPDQASRMMDAWRICLRHAGHIQSTNQLLLCRMGTEIRLAVYDSMRAAAARGVLGNGGYDEAIRLFGDADPGDIDLPEAIRGEWGGTLGLVQALYANGRLNRELAEMVGYVDGRGGARTVSPSRIRTSRITPAELATAVDEHFAQLLASAKRPLTIELLREVDALERKNASGNLAGHPLRPLIQPTLRIMFRQQLRSATSARATRLVLILLEHHAVHETWRDSLLHVCDNALLRTDPFSGREFAYWRTSASEVDVELAFSLYSVGEDGEDDGGAHATWDDLFKPAHQGEDYVFWPFQDRQTDTDHAESTAVCPPDGKQFRARVESVGPMSHHTGPVKFTEREPSFVLTLKVVESREQTAGCEPGSMLHYAIHSVARFFRTAQGVEGREFTFCEAPPRDGVVHLQPRRLVRATVHPLSLVVDKE